MNKWMWGAALSMALLMIGAVMFRPVSTQASERAESKIRTLSVVGRGEIKASYDTAHVTVGVEETRESAEQAYRAMADKMNRLVDALKAQGIKEEQLKTGQFHLTPVYDWTEKSGRILRGYTATNTLTVSTKNLDEVAVLVERVVNAGGNRVDSVSFSIENADALLKQALDMAIEDAKSKAEQVAKKFGVEIIGVSEIQVNDSGYPSLARIEMGRTVASDAVSSMPAPIFSGSAEFSASVSVVFEIR